MESGASATSRVIRASETRGPVATVGVAAVGVVVGRGRHRGAPQATANNHCLASFDDDPERFLKKANDINRTLHDNVTVILAS